MTRQEQQYYNNIERIAIALEKLVAQGEQANNQGRYDKIKNAGKLLYGNHNDQGYPPKGRSKENYDYPNKQVKNDNSFNGWTPNITSKLDQHMYDTSQQVKGGEFMGWYNSLNKEEKESYKRIYRGSPDNTTSPNK